jgi:hypothetical protein
VQTLHSAIISRDTGLQELFIRLALDLDQVRHFELAIGMIASFSCFPRVLGLDFGWAFALAGALDFAAHMVKVVLSLRSNSINGLCFDVQNTKAACLTS